MDAWEKKAAARHRREKLRAKCLDYLGGKCRICGYQRCASALDAHHLDSHEKDFNLSRATSWAKAQPELDKCVLLCSNCHREVHEGMHPEYLLDDAFEGEREYGWD